MQLHYDFNLLWMQVQRLTTAIEPYTLARNSNIDPIDIALEDAGVEVRPIDLDDFGGLLSYKGRQVLLYIPDHGAAAGSVLDGTSEGKKFHVAHCQTLEMMKKAHRFERYVATKKLDGKFLITGLNYDTNTQVKGDASLLICMFCLGKLNYKKAAESSSIRRKVRDEFSITEFFETYSSCFPYQPIRTAPDFGKNGYTADWKEVSRATRALAGWKCTSCGINLSDNKHLLHTHHSDGNKANNSRMNLSALCAACHQDQPMHYSMYIHYQDMQTITRKRREEGVIKNNWDSALKYADPALRGFLNLAKNSGAEAPEIGFPVFSNVSNSSVQMDAAWPNRHIAVRLHEEKNSVDIRWKIWGLGEALKRFS